MAAGPTYEPIATTTLGSAASISSAYTDLRVVVVGTTTSGTDVRLRFNSDSGTNYSITALYRNGTTATSNRATSASAIDVNSFIAGMGSTPKMYSIDIFSYAGSTYKTALCTASEDNNGSGYVDRRVGLWRSTSAITTITMSGATYATGTTATLYGILKA
jgi:hypothetical protein